MDLTGKMAEEEIMGATELNPEHPLYKKAKQNKGYLSFNDSLRLARESQVGDPSDPESGIANDFHAAVAETLKEDDYEKVRFFSALGTPLDVYHGVDGFFEHNGIIVTLDATINPNKDKDSIKADIILEEMPDPKFEREKYLEYIKDKSKEIAYLIEKRQIEKMKNRKAS